MQALPKSEKLTIRWLIDQVPFGWWWSVASVAAALIVGAFTIGRATSQPPGTDELQKLTTARNLLNAEVAGLTGKRDSLRHEIDRLQIDVQIEKMPPGAAQKELRDHWSRD